jgi:polar amino acid transport system permease protein
MSDLLKQFFDFSIMWDSLPHVLKGFRLNVQIFLWAEAIVLGWALLVAVARLTPGRAAAPVRWIAIAYIDVFRGLPAIVVIYLVGFALPKLTVPFFSDMSLFQRGITALVLVYGAYVAEVYRAGIESVHWSQTAAARSLGLSHTQTLRHVVLPQAVRRVIPPLLNDFIGLQKDAALVSVIGLVDGLRQANLQASKFVNASPIVGLGICYVLITIPLARVVDYLIRRDQRRMVAGQ